MKVGIAFTLKPDSPPPPGVPDDLHEEFDSPVTIRAIAGVLRSLGHEVSELGDGRPLLEALLRDPPDCVFNFAEGTGASRSREARVPAVCEMLGIPYTGSDPLALAVALEKDMTRRLVADAGVTIPKGFVFHPPGRKYDGDFAEFPPILETAELGLPVIVKPVSEGSSKGIRNRCLIERLEDFGPVLVGLAADYDQPVLVEEFISGDEVTIGLVGNDPPQVIGLMRVVPRDPNRPFVYSLEVKRDYQDFVDYECPARLNEDVARSVAAEALAVWEALGIRDVARMDFRVRNGVPYFIEVNPLPGLNPETSDLVILADRMGMPHTELVTRIFESAITRSGRTGASRRS